MSKFHGPLCLYLLDLSVTIVNSLMCVKTIWPGLHIILCFLEGKMRKRTLENFKKTHYQIMVVITIQSGRLHWSGCFIANTKIHLSRGSPHYFLKTVQIWGIFKTGDSSCEDLKKAILNLLGAPKPCIHCTWVMMTGKLSRYKYHQYYLPSTKPLSGCPPSR